MSRHDPRDHPSQARATTCIQVSLQPVSRNPAAALLKLDSTVAVARFVDNQPIDRSVNRGNPKEILRKSYGNPMGILRKPCGNAK